jgi:hypothetical protein
VLRNQHTVFIARIFDIPGMIHSPAELVHALDRMVEKAIANKSAGGYFAALYARMSRAVVEGIAAGRFDDGPRMERLMVVFGNRYLYAMEQWNRKEHSGNAWNKAFEAAEANRVSILQHLLLGINAHINLDLGVAAGQIAPGAAIQGLKRDFETINDVIAGLVDVVQDKLAELSMPMRFLDRLAGTGDEKVANFSINVARKAAWRVAETYAGLGTGAQQTAFITEVDILTAALAEKIIRPGWIPNLLLRPVKWFEPADVAENLRVLRQN